MNELATDEMKSSKDPVRQEASGSWWAARALDRASTNPADLSA